MVGRRLFLREIGRGAVAIAVLGGTGSLALACDSDDDNEAEGTPASTATATATATEAATAEATATPSPTGTAAASASPAAGAVELHRVNLGFVSAYVLARDGRAVVVDTGVAGSEPDIADALAVAGLGWEAVSDVIVTHLHPDHQGSLPAVLDLASAAMAYAGAADIPGITAPRPLVAIGDGDEVFGLQIVETPGHTPGHVCVLDPVSGLLVAGDALVGADGGVGGPNPDFTPDLDAAYASVRKLAGLQFETVVFGHGEPVAGGAAAAVAALAESL
jgi:glyoxylase-like metal-dependent hydrolase (beta-lactamase superfamily II)